MQSAFLAAAVLPPPAPRADVFAWPDHARAGLAADGGEALRVQRIDGNGVFGNVGFQPFERPIGDGVELDKPKLGIHDLGTVACGYLAVIRPASDKSTPTADLHAAFTGWAELEGHEQLSPAVFGR